MPHTLLPHDFSSSAPAGAPESWSNLAHSAKPNSRHQQLGAFLRARRESLDPQRLALPRSGRRRTPGLRREEVALLADVGVTWYTWLEQGRTIQPSARALAAIAEALQCSTAETRHVFSLAGLGEPPGDGEHRLCESLSNGARLLLDQLGPYPALIQNVRFDIVGFNPAYCRLVNIDLDQIPLADRNCLYLALTHPDWRASIGDLEQVMQRMVAYFRAAMADHMGEPAWEERLARFMAVSEDFRRIWQRYEIHGIENQTKCFRHPREGILRLHQTNWWSAPRNGDRLVAYMPADEPTAQALQRMARQPALTVRG